MTKTTIPVPKAIPGEKAKITQNVTLNKTRTSFKEAGMLQKLVHLVVLDAFGCTIPYLFICSDLE